MRKPASNASAQFLEKLWTLFSKELVSNKNSQIVYGSDSGSFVLYHIFNFTFICYITKFCRHLNLLTDEMLKWENKFRSYPNHCPSLNLFFLSEDSLQCPKTAQRTKQIILCTLLEPSQFYTTSSKLGNLSFSSLWSGQNNYPQYYQYINYTWFC